MKSIKAVFRVSRFVKTLKGRVADADSLQLVLPAGVAGATKNKLRRRRMRVISPPGFFPLFSLPGPGFPHRCPHAKQFGAEKED